jgi:hypothetical protein
MACFGTRRGGRCCIERRRREVRWGYRILWVGTVLGTRALGWWVGRVRWDGRVVDLCLGGSGGRMIEVRIWMVAMLRT